MLNEISRVASRVVVKSKINSPRALFVLGLVSVGAGTVLAVRATMKAEPHLDDAQVALADINSVPETVYEGSGRKHDKTIVYAECTYQLVKLYAPSVACTVIGVALLTKSHTMLSQRNAALGAAYAGLDKLYRTYRARVREEVGEVREDRIHRESVQEIAEREIPRAPIANKKYKSRKDPTIYARFFDESSRNWRPEPEYNMVFLRSQQGFLNDMLHSRGHVFLNEVYDQLGLERSRAGAVVGWALNNDGDNHIDFGIFDGHTMEARDFVNGWESRILLDFNVDGVITDKLRDWRPRS